MVTLIKLFRQIDRLNASANISANDVGRDRYWIDLEATLIKQYSLDKASPKDINGLRCAILYAFAECADSGIIDHTYTTRCFEIYRLYSNLELTLNLRMIKAKLIKAIKVCTKGLT